MEPKDRPTPPDARAQHRAYVLEHVVDGGLTIEQAAHILKLSTRQVGRLLVRYRDGPALLGHGNRGRAPANRLADDRRAQLVELATTTYAGVNGAHLAELLAEREGIVVAERTLRRILAETGLRPVRRRRPRKHRSRRDRVFQGASRSEWVLRFRPARSAQFSPGVDRPGRRPTTLFAALEVRIGNSRRPNAPPLSGNVLVSVVRPSGLDLHAYISPSGRAGVLTFRVG